MRHRRFTARSPVRLAPAAFLGLLGLLGLLTATFAPGCARKPDSPAWTNPFDPEAADPFHLTALATENAVVLLWDAPPFSDIAAYEVRRSLDNQNFYSVDATTADVNSYFDTSFVPNRVNYYKVRARNTAGEVSGTSRQVAAAGLTYPRLDIAGGAQTTPTRHVTLSIVTAAGDSLEIADNATFAGALRLVASTTDTNHVTWDLGAATANGQRMWVWLRVKTGAVFSLVTHDSVVTSFRPDLQIRALPATLATRRLTLDIPGSAGMTRLRFAPTRAELSAMTWAAPDSFVTDHAWFTGDVLGAAASPQWLYGEFEGDFGYTFVDSLLCEPDDLASASFQLAGGAAVTLEPSVALASVAVATEMRFSEDPAFPSVPWLAWAAASEFTFSADPDSLRILPGTKVVYGQFRNDWFSAVRTATIVFSPTAPPRIR